jgi:hypothetical protein
MGFEYNITACSLERTEQESVLESVLSAVKSHSLNLTAYMKSILQYHNQKSINTLDFYKNAYIPISQSEKHKQTKLL